MSRNSSCSKWYCFNGYKFVPIKLKQGEASEDLLCKPFLGKLLFRAFTTVSGGHGQLYAATPSKLIRLEATSDVRSFVDLFTPHELSSNHADWLKRLLNWRDKIKCLIPYGKRVFWTRAVDEFMEHPIDYLGRLLCMNNRSKTLSQMEKLLHQLYVLLKIPKVLGGEIIDENVWVEQEMKSNIKWLDEILPVTWGKPTFKFRSSNGVMYSVWLEFSAPHPVDIISKILAIRDLLKEESSDIHEKAVKMMKVKSILKNGSTKRFDIIVQKGDHDSMFLIDPHEIRGVLNNLSPEEWALLPNFFFLLMKRIDLLIECKEQPFQNWQHDIKNQILPYYSVYRPKRMAIISAYPVPDNVKSCLKSRGIDVIAPFGPCETPYDQEASLRRLIESL